MMYLLYILIGLLIVLGVNLAITAFCALHDMYVHRDLEAQDFTTFKKYFVKNNIFQLKCQIFSINEAAARRFFCWKKFRIPSFKLIERTIMLKLKANTKRLE